MTGSGIIIQGEKVLKTVLRLSIVLLVAALVTIAPSGGYAQTVDDKAKSGASEQVTQEQKEKDREKPKDESEAQGVEKRKSGERSWFDRLLHRRDRPVRGRR